VTPEETDVAATGEVAADEIDGAFVPRKRHDVTEVFLEGEAVVLSEGRAQAQYLDEIATLVWQTFDGSATIEELSNDFAAAFGAEVETVSADIVALAREAGRAGLLAGVAYEPPPAPSPFPMGVAAGESIPPFELPDERGRMVSLEDLSGRQLLLVNWSPRCGFCLRIAPELGSLRSQLKERGVELVFLTIGEVDENQAIFEEAGLDETVLFVTEGIPEAFAGVGTPSAYLVDAEGRAASPLTIGADQVPSLARAAAGREIPLTER
jgi:peroxiredoxin